MVGVAVQDAEGPHGAAVEARRRDRRQRRQLSALETQNVGKPTAIAGDEMPFSADNLRFFAGAARSLEEVGIEYVEGYFLLLRREPLGIVAGITPWNYPLIMAIWKIGPALAAGNVQIKPAEQTPLTTLRFVKLTREFLPPACSRS